MKLYEISDQYTALLEMAEENGLTEDIIRDTLESIEGDFTEKADNLACLIKTVLAEAEAIKAEKDKLDDRFKIKKAYADRLKTYLFEQMLAIGKNKIETSRNVLSIRKTPGAVKIEDEEKFIVWAEKNNVPLLKITPPAPDKTKIKQWINGGGEIEGVTVEQGTTLSIK